MIPVLAAIGGLFSVALVCILISAHLCDVVEAAVRAQGRGLRAYRAAVVESWAQSKGII